MRKQLALLLFSVTVSSIVLIQSCSKESVSANAPATGQGGSVTRFTIAKNYLYAVSNHNLYVYSLSNPEKPELVNTLSGFDIETIYPYNNYLFLGSKTGLFVYSIDTASSPRLIGQAQHARACDPVVVNDSVAFVTLKHTGNCGPAVAGLYIHDITNITQPVLKDSIPLPDPAGLGLQDNILYVCCGSDGMKVFNIKNPYSPSLISTKTDGNYLDVIPYNGILICAMNDGILLYDIKEPGTPALIKKIIN